MTTISIDVGGTGAATAAAARANLGVPGLASANTFSAPQTPSTGAVAISSTQTFTYNPATHGQVCTITLTNAIVLTLAIQSSSLVAGTVYRLRLVAGDNLARTLLKTSAIRVEMGGTLPIDSCTVIAGAADHLVFLAIDNSTVECIGSLRDVR